MFLEGKGSKDGGNKNNNSPPNLGIFKEAVLFVGTVVFLPQQLFFITVIIIDICNVYMNHFVSRLWRGGTCEEEELMKMKGHLPIPTFEIDSSDWTWDSLRNDHVKKGIPFILKPSKVSGPIAKYCPPNYDEKTGNWKDSITPKVGCLDMRTQSLFARVPGLHTEIIDNLLPWATPSVPLIIAGNYKRGDCHVDTVPNGTNCYWMMRGSKDIVIVPPHITRKTPLCGAKEHILIVPGSIDGYDYLNDLEAYYRFTLEEGQLLVFHHTACLHHFGMAKEPKSDTDTPIAIAFQNFNFYYAKGADPRCWYRVLFNPWTIWGHTKKAARLFLFDDPLQIRVSDY